MSSRATRSRANRRSIGKHARRNPSPDLTGLTRSECLDSGDNYYINDDGLCENDLYCLLTGAIPAIAQTSGVSVYTFAVSSYDDCALKATYNVPANMGSQSYYVAYSATGTCKLVVGAGATVGSSSSSNDKILLPSSCPSGFGATAVTLIGQAPTSSVMPLYHGPNHCQAAH